MPRRMRYGPRLLGLLTLALAPAAIAQSAEQRLHRAYYLEHERHDYATAQQLYAQAASDRAASPEIAREARRRADSLAEELRTADLATLLPVDTLLYAELNTPADHLVDLLRGIGLDADHLPSDAAAGQPRVSPDLVRALLGIRRAALAVTGFDMQSQQPRGVLIVHPGEMALLRGVVETGLPFAATPTEPIGGFPTYSVEGDVFVTLTQRLVIASQQRSEIAGVVERLAAPGDISLATNEQFAPILAERSGATFFVGLHAKPLLPMINGLLAAGAAHDPEVAIAQALLDPASFESGWVRLTISDQQIALDASAHLAEHHRNLVYNLLTMPPVDRRTLGYIPSDAAFFAAFAMNPAGAGALTPLPGDSSRSVVSLLDFGREIFANLLGVSVFGLPEHEALPSGQPLPAVALVMTMRDPSRSEALWSQMLGLAAVQTGRTPLEGQPTQIGNHTARSFQIGPVTAYLVQQDDALLISASRAALEAALRSPQQRSAEGPLATLLDSANGDTKLLAGVSVAACMDLARPYAGADPQFDQVRAAMQNLTTNIRIDQTHRTLRLHAGATGLPDVGGLVMNMLQRERQQHRDQLTLKTALRRGNLAEALDLVETQIDARPDDRTLLARRIEILLRLDRPADAADAADTLANAAGDDARYLNNMAWEMLTEREVNRGVAEVARRLSAASNNQTGHRNWMFLDTLALAHFELGDVPKAIELERKALNHCSDAGRRSEVEAALARFEAAAAAPPDTSVQ